MFRKTILTTAILAIALAAANSAQAAWPNLNPFSTQKSSSNNSWWPSSKSTSNQPSTLTKISNGTKSMMKKTGDALNPTKWGTTTANDTPQQTLRKSMTPSRTASKAAKSETSWWSPWPAEKADDRPQTVADFLKQKRPSFDD